MSKIENEVPEEVDQEALARLSQGVQDNSEEITPNALDKLKNINQNKYVAIARDGGRIEPSSVFSLRFETFLDTFLSEQDKLVFEYNFESRMREQLDAMLTQIRQAKITAGTQGIDAKKLIIGK